MVNEGYKDYASSLGSLFLVELNSHGILANIELFINVPIEWTRQNYRNHRVDFLMLNKTFKGLQ